MTATIGTAQTDTITAGRELDVVRLGPRFGAELRGIDVTTADDGQIALLREALVEFKVIVLRDQHITDAQHVQLAQRLGETTIGHPVWDSGDVPDEVFTLDSTDNGFADEWHTDVTFMPRPPAGSVLRPIVLPSTGGDTNWADGELAYESLSPQLRGVADELYAYHDGEREFGYYLRQRRGGVGNVWEGKQVTALVPTRHPVVRIHPETGRKALFVNPGFTSYIEGVSDAESRGLLDIFYAHLTKPEHIVRHRWTLGDIVLWDNRNTLHYANRDYLPERRVMHRVTLRGDEPVGPAD
ncbi:MAG TPA: TauD/TfdA family dioxygenase [Gordonia sp. (in: high G+C Gram-positive bacteria)]|uniref:TauD/TfdA dioxygenase family protein n=1 Tax=unclassified Gordonia (in: high G+C Gram-positive bacteria) TaxID=2657482 RepID=UPI000FA0806E|nr:MULTISPECIES: TauD/TfdA family dioxygenase [unclassified Gordonia (in: high G+C Gram-positive bacteria)]RUP41535.1 MAG: taurine dioxygenase [Gordonia sp. (in: high G+C Gram-positive bacteria)]HNP56621.1 TauD/TfdA family dioxygenase [Gordonia sp. (in: high G+C Gram-positive bacteria)]HRC50291.1 TauD/TfdA family dioxygenase [Gordonia sp. (in: high G+C Gram-positive bacteria)]